MKSLTYTRIIKKYITPTQTLRYQCIFTRKNKPSHNYIIDKFNCFILNKCIDKPVH